MYNWSGNKAKINKKTKAYRLWHLEQLINFGLNGEKINLKDLKKYWNELNIDNNKRRFLQLFL